jgi:hypothetical protein
MSEPGSPASSAKPRPPLDGFDLAIYPVRRRAAGTQVLAGLAPVIKIEDGRGGDVARYVPPTAGEADLHSSRSTGASARSRSAPHQDGQPSCDGPRLNAVFNNARDAGQARLTYEALKSSTARGHRALTDFGFHGPALPSPPTISSRYAGYMAGDG